MAETKARTRRNGTRKAAKKEVPRRKVYDLDDMPAERDAIRILGEVYEFAGPADISAQDIAEMNRLEQRIREQEEEPEPETEAEKGAQIEEMMRMMNFRTRLILSTPISDEVLDQITARQHLFIYTSFLQASGEDGARLEAAMEATKALDSQT